MEDPTWMSAYFDLNALGDFDEPIANFEDMTAVELEAVLRDAWPNDALPTRHSSGQPKSPSPSSLPQGSVSPEDGNPEYTPTSSNVPDWSNDVNWNLQYDGLEISPMFATSTTDESDGISPIDSRCSVYSSMSRPPHSSQGISSVRRSRDSSPALPNTNTNGQWTSIAATMNMTGHQSGTAQAPGNTAFDDTAINTTEAFNQSLLSDMTLSYNTMPFRPAYTQSWGDLDMGQVSRHTMSDPPFAHPWSSFPLTTHDAHYLPTLPTTQHYAVQPDGPNQPQQINHTIDPVQHQRIPHYPSQLPSSGTIPQPSGNLSQQMPLTATVVPSTSPRPTQGPPPQSAYSRATQLRYRQPPSISIDTSACAPRSAQDLIAVVPARNVRSTTQPQSPEGKRPKGGRAKGGHLNPANKQRVARMRKTGACWRCAMQRDSCDGNEPCERCIKAASKPGNYFFPCNRSKIPDFILDFLPPSMTLMHQKQPIEDYVQEQVRGWNTRRPIDVYLTSGYGHALRWRLYEFDPRSIELLGQFQYLQDVQSRKSVRFQKYSPPLGLMKLDPTDDRHFRNYLDELMEPGCLWDLAWTCFEEETQVNDFQAVLLDLMCSLYLKTEDVDLRELLHRIIRMMIITYIMGHTLTISEDTLPSVVSHIQHPWKPARLERHTSPRLANRQLKFFFGVLRSKIYEDLLKWQQATLRTASRKEDSWLGAFCVMLGLAMVLEEQQRTIQIQADAKAHKGERSAEEAQQEALNACERMDEKYKLLIGLFQCKYRDKKWTRGSFGQQTPTMSEPAQVEFLTEVHSLLQDKVVHLQSREKVSFSSENQCQYTSRLVARFLLPFLNLPA